MYLKLKASKKMPKENTGQVGRDRIMKEVCYAQGWHDILQGR